MSWDSDALRKPSHVSYINVVHKFFMRISTTILLVTILIQSYGQVALGTGIVEILFDDKTIVDFYSAPMDKGYFKRIEFFDDQGSWNIRNLEKEKNWLRPEVLWLDYSRFIFRCKSTTMDWLEVIVNNEDGKSLWIKKNERTRFLSWEEYLKNMFAIDRRWDKPQKIRKSPTETAVEINYEGRDCFQVRSLRGEWIEIFTADHCDEAKTVIKIKSGWVKWRQGNELLINYYPTS